MAVNIFDKYGIKEVANVYFEALADDLDAGVYEGDVVLFLDTLKVSTIETTAENTAAQGGWGNPRLVSWDYGKEITVTLTDALMSLESLRFMLGGAIKRSKADKPVWVHRTEEFVVDEGGVVPQSFKYEAKAVTGHPIRLINLGGGKDSTTAGSRTQITGTDAAPKTLKKGATIKFYNKAAGIGEVTGEGQNTTKTSVAPTKGDHIRVFWEEEEVNTDAAIEVTISPSTFPGTYKIVGDTFMRSEKTGKDEPFQFVINKAKVQSSVTITLEAEGDPSTFEMTLQVLRDKNDSGDNEMMKLVRYTITDTETAEEEDDIGSLTPSGS